MEINIQHPGIISPLFELAKTIEFDIEIGDEQFSYRLELFQDRSDARRFRARVWRLELYRIQSTFPQINGQPADQPSDESIFVEWEWRRRQDFQAETPELAIQVVLNDLLDFLIHTLGESDA